MAGLYVTPATLNKAVTTSGTRVPLFSTETPAKTCTIQALKGNTNDIFVGSVTVSTSVYGVRLTPGTSFSFSVGSVFDSRIDLSQIYLDATTNGEAVSVFYF